MSYTVKTLDLGAIIPDDSRVQVIPNNTTISEVVILKFPVTTTIRLAFGDSPLFEVTGPISFQPRGQDEQERGLFWSNPVAQPGVKIQVIVASGGTVNPRSV